MVFRRQNTGRSARVFLGFRRYMILAQINQVYLILTTYVYIFEKLVLSVDWGVAGVKTKMIRDRDSR